VVGIVIRVKGGVLFYL